MKRTFTETPAMWLRAPRVSQTPAEYASAVERFAEKGHSVAPWVGIAILCVIFAGVVAGAQ